MSPVVALTVFAAIFPAELPDKTFIATLVLSTRFRPLAVWLGAAAGFVVQTTVAVAAGGALALLPKQPVRAVAAALFAVGAVLVVRESGDVEHEEQELQANIADVPAQPSLLREAITTFVVIFIAEWGDLSQLLTAAFAARYHSVFDVGLGALTALLLVAGIGALGGRALLRVVPVIWVRRAASAIFAVLAVVTAINAARV